MARLVVGPRDKQDIKPHSESFSRKSYCIAHRAQPLHHSVKLSIQSHFVSILHPTPSVNILAIYCLVLCLCSLSRSDQIMGVAP